MLLQARYSSSIGTKVLEHEDEGPPSGSESDCLEDKYCDLVEKRQKEMQKDGGMTMDEMMKAIAGSTDPQDPATPAKGTSKPGKGHALRDTPTKAKKRRMDETLEEASDDGELGVAGGSKLTSRNTPNRRQAYKGGTQDRLPSQDTQASSSLQTSRLQTSMVQVGAAGKLGSLSTQIARWPASLLLVRILPTSVSNGRT